MQAYMKWFSGSKMLTPGFPESFPEGPRRRSPGTLNSAEYTLRLTYRATPELAGRGKNSKVLDAEFRDGRWKGIGGIQDTRKNRKGDGPLKGRLPISSAPPGILHALCIIYMPGAIAEPCSPGAADGIRMSGCNLRREGRAAQSLTPGISANTGFRGGINRGLWISDCMRVRGLMKM